MDTTSTGDAVGIRIGVLRTRLGWSIRELARRSRVSPSHISEIERGVQEHPRPITLDAIAIALGWPTFEQMMATNEVEPPRYANVTKSVDSRGDAAHYQAANGGGGIPSGVITNGWPVYGWETAGDPLAGEETQQPIVINTLPFVREVALVAGPRTFALEVGDETLTHWDGAGIGAWCLIDPDKAAKPDHLVCCRIRTLAGAWRLIVRELKVEENGRRMLITAGRQSADSVAVEEAQLIGLVVKIVNVSEPKKRDLNDDMESFVTRVHRPNQIIPKAG